MQTDTNYCKSNDKYDNFEKFIDDFREFDTFAFIIAITMKYY